MDQPIVEVRACGSVAARVIVRNSGKIVITLVQIIGEVKTAVGR